MAINANLFEELAKAKAQPSRASRAAMSALAIPEQALQGYLSGTDIANKLQEIKQTNQTLEQALNGNVPESVSGYRKLSVRQFKPTAELLAGVAALEKSTEKKPSEFYTPEQAEAVASGDPKKLQAAFGPSIPRTAVAANTTARGVSGKNDFFGTRAGQINLQQLPSELGPNTAAGAAFGVKVAARQGKSIIANPGSAQRVALASGDIARAVLRAAPQLDAQRGADFSQNLATRISLLSQKISSDPNGPDVPKLRKEMYDILDDLDKSATPFIENHLNNYEEMLTPLPLGVRQRELGENLPNIPFNAGSEGVPTGFRTFNTPEEAEASGYKGPAVIGGRKAVVH